MRFVIEVRRPSYRFQSLAPALVSIGEHRIVIESKVWREGHTIDEGTVAEDAATAEQARHNVAVLEAARCSGYLEGHAPAFARHQRRIELVSVHVEPGVGFNEFCTFDLERIELCLKAEADRHPADLLVGLSKMCMPRTTKAFDSG